MYPAFHPDAKTGQALPGLVRNLSGELGSLGSWLSLKQGALLFILPHRCTPKDLQMDMGVKALQAHKSFGTAFTHSTTFSGLSCFFQALKIPATPPNHHPFSASFYTNSGCSLAFDHWRME